MYCNQSTATTTRMSQKIGRSIAHDSQRIPLAANRNQRSGWKTSCVILLAFCAASAIAASAQTFTTLASFDNNTGFGSSGFSSLVQGPDGNFYGTGQQGGANNSSLFRCTGCGTVFRFTPGAGKGDAIYSFCMQANCTDGASPQSGMVLGTDGSFYGGTAGGGCCGGGGCGTLFKITPGGALTTLRKLASTSGASP